MISIASSSLTVQARVFRRRRNSSHVSVMPRVARPGNSNSNGTASAAATTPPKQSPAGGRYLKRGTATVVACADAVGIAAAEAVSGGAGQGARGVSLQFVVIRIEN